MGLELLGLMALGFTAAVLAYLLGIGGGVVIVPVLVVFFKFHVHEAIAISLVVIVASSLSLTSANLKNRMTNIRLGIYLELTTIIGAVSGGLVSVNLSGKTLSTVFAAVMFALAYLMWRNSGTDRALEEKPEQMGPLDGSYTDAREGTLKYYHVHHPNIVAAVSFFAGIGSGMFGIGGGVFKVPVMNIIAGIPLKAATATSNFMICFTAAAGSLPYLMNGYFHPEAAGAMVIGAYAGAKFATGRLTKVQNRNIKLLFIIFILGVAIEMAYKAVHG